MPYRAGQHKAYLEIADCIQMHANDRVEVLAYVLSDKVEDSGGSSQFLILLLEDWQ